MTAAASHFIRETIRVDHAAFPSVTYLPPGYSDDTPYPVILFLHGAGEAGSDGDKQTRVGIGVQLRRRPELYPAIVVMPQSPGQWRGMNAKMALAALDQATRQYGADLERVYITGISMGGFGTWFIAAADPNRFAAAVPICGGGDTRTMAPRLIDLPIWAVHGAADEIVPVAYSREMADAIRAAGGSNIRYSELPGVGHNSWDWAYSNKEMVEWLLAQRQARNHK